MSYRPGLPPISRSAARCSNVANERRQGVAPARGILEVARGDQPVLVLIDELVLYMARVFALREDQTRSKVNSQWATFLQTLFSSTAFTG